MAPPVVIFPIFRAKPSVNQSAPSGPAVIGSRPLKGVGTGYSVKAPVTTEGCRHWVLGKGTSRSDAADLVGHAFRKPEGTIRPGRNSVRVAIGLYENAGRWHGILSDADRHRTAGRSHGKSSGVGRPAAGRRVRHNHGETPNRGQV